MPGITDIPTETQETQTQSTETNGLDVGGERVSVQQESEHSSIRIPSRGIDTTGGEGSDVNATQNNTSTESTSGDQSVETGSGTDNKNTDQAQGSAQGTETSSTPAFDFGALSKEIELDFADADGLKNILTEYKTLKTKSSEFESISPAMQEAIKAEKAGMDLNQFFNLRGRDFDSMDGKDLLRERYLKENAQLFKDNPEFAKKRFEREYNAKYSVLNKQFDDEQERADWEEENAEDLSYARLELEHDIKLAREEMNKWKTEATRIPEQAQGQDGLSPEKQAEMAQQYQENVQKFLGEYKGLELALDNQTAPFKYGTSQEVKQALQESLSNPSGFLAEIGFTDDGIDVAKFGQAVMKYKHFEKAVQNAAQYLVEQKNKQTVEGKLEHPRNPDHVNNGAPAVRTLEEKLADAFASKRQQNRGGFY
jgi:hypothetical protein